MCMGGGLFSVPLVLTCLSDVGCLRAAWTQGHGVHAYRMLVVKSTWTQGRGCLARHGQPVSVKSVGRLAQAMSRLVFLATRRLEIFGDESPGDIER